MSLLTSSSSSNDIQATSILSSSTRKQGIDVDVRIDTPVKTIQLGESHNIIQLMRLLNHKCWLSRTSSGYCTRCSRTMLKQCLQIACGSYSWKIMAPSSMARLREMLYNMSDSGPVLMCSNKSTGSNQIPQVSSSISTERHLLCPG